VDPAVGEQLNATRRYDDDDDRYHYHYHLEDYDQLRARDMERLVVVTSPRVTLSMSRGTLVTSSSSSARQPTTVADSALEGGRPSPVVGPMQWTTASRRNKEEDRTNARKKSERTEDNNSYSA